MWRFLKFVRKKKVPNASVRRRNECAFDNKERAECGADLLDIQSVEDITEEAERAFVLVDLQIHEPKIDKRM